MIKKATQTAREVLQRLGHDLPIDIYSIVKAHNITLDTQLLEDVVYGLLILKGTQAVICVNKKHDPNRQRFSAAHSLGHYLLHQGEAELFIDSSSPPGGDNPFVNSKLQEISADTFASELLMPKAILKRQLGNQPLNIHDTKAIRQFATLFGVSQPILISRLTKLGLATA